MLRSCTPPGIVQTVEREKKQQKMIVQSARSAKKRPNLLCAVINTSTQTLLDEHQTLDIKI